MENTLCIETSGAYSSVALAVDGQIFSKHEHLQRQHNEYLLAMLDELFVAAGGQKLVLERVVFSSGPGSFTGIRLGAATAQAIALKDAAEVRGLNSSRVLAASQMKFAQSLSGQTIVTAIRSRGDAYYLTVFEVGDDDGLKVLHSDELCTTAPEWLEEILVSKSPVESFLVGECPSWLTDRVAGTTPDSSVGKPILSHSSLSGPHAEAMLPLAVALEPSPGALELPLYLEGDSPWKKQSASI